MERLSKSFSLNGLALVAKEDNLGTENKRARMQSDARTLRASQNGSGDPALLSFAEQIYAVLASCTEGEVPDLDAAYGLTDEQLDCWFESVHSVNASWLQPRENVGEAVTFRDGNTLQIVSGDLPSVLRKLYQLEKAAADYEVDQDYLVQKNFLYPL